MPRVASDEDGRLTGTADRISLSERDSLLVLALLESRRPLNDRMRAAIRAMPKPPGAPAAFKQPLR